MEGAHTERGEMWRLPPVLASVPAAVLRGYEVEAQDGRVGTVLLAGAGYLIVAANAPIAERMVMLPAGIIERIDRGRRTLSVSRSLAEIATAPRFEADRYQDGAYRAEMGRHYARPANAGGALR